MQNLRAKRNPFTLAIYLIVLGLSSSHLFAYDPPIGIPAPPFGIDDSHLMYSGKNYDAGGFTYLDAGNGPYTHYIDNSSSACTDSSNPYGTAAKPRCSLPTDAGATRSATFPAGSVIEIHGGISTPYTRSGIYQVVLEGTPDKPVFIRGYVKDETKYPQYVNTDFRIAGSYFIFENLDIYDNCQFVIRPDYDHTGQNRSEYVSIRNLHIHEPVNDSGDMNGTSATGDHIVYFNNHVHDNWKSDIQDAHGIYIGEGSTNAWILENHIYGNSGNAFQSCNACSASPPEYIYVGKNVMHGDKELAIGMKYANHVIISQNKIYDYTVSSTAQGTGIVIGADGPTENVWMIFNEIYNVPYGIRIEETNTDVFIIGNIIYDVANAAINLEKEGPNVYLNNNTIYNVGQFINQTWQDDFIIHARNNIFSKSSSTASIHLESNLVATPSYMHNNLFYEDGQNMTIYWGSDRDTYSTTADISTFPGGVDNLLESPSFYNVSTQNFMLTNTSLGIDSGDSDTDSSYVYDTYKARYGIDIQLDFSGNRRPYGSGWDMGAFEMGATTPKPAPSPPTLSTN